MTVILTDRRYDEDDIRIDSFLSTRTRISRFLGQGGSSTLNKLADAPLKKLARQLYLHAEVVDKIENTPFFSQMSLVVSEPVFDNEWNLPQQNSIPIGTKDLNEKKSDGRAIVYSLVDDWGITNVSMNFELALFLKDTVLCDEVILDYDTYNPNGSLNVNVIVIMPEVDDSFNVLFKRNVQTWYNNKVCSNSDLVEIG